MKTLIIEDEKIAAQRLLMLLHEYDPEIEVLACKDSVEESVNWLQNNQPPDLLLLDIQLADGFSFEIFKRVRYDRPIIFTTAYNEYALDAFRYFSIDYLLKPIEYDALQSALDKYKQITRHTAALPDFEVLFESFHKKTLPQYKDRFLGKIGQRLFFIKTTDIAYFRVDDKLVHIVDKSGHKYLTDNTLEKLETLLDPKFFFRLNRKVIVNIDGIAQVKSYFNSRLLLHLKDGNNTEEVVISRERVAEFKSWAGQ